MADPTEPDEGGGHEESSVVKDLRAKAKRVEEAEARAEAAERKLAVAESGFTSLNDLQREALQSAHKGEWTPEAIKATAEALFGKQAAGQSTPASEPAEDQGDPTAKAEASELDSLSSSPAAFEEPENAPIRTQEAFDKKVMSFWEANDEDGLDQWLRDNTHLLPFGSTAPMQ